uniref:Putative cubilin n=1 Tax=Lygus hesperus TaxID=30085 RepID=A0A0A9W8I2_LYGHE
MQHLSSVYSDLSTLTKSNNSLTVNRVLSTGTGHCALQYLCSRRYHTQPDANCTHCVCESGYDGDTSSEQPICFDINECSWDSGPCDIHAICVNTWGGFTCSSCPTHFIGDGYYRCFSVIELALLTLSLLSHSLLFFCILRSVWLYLTKLFHNCISTLYGRCWCFPDKGAATNRSLSTFVLYRVPATR